MATVIFRVCAGSRCDRHPLIKALLLYDNGPFSWPGRAAACTQSLMHRTRGGCRFTVTASLHIANFHFGYHAKYPVANVTTIYLHSSIAPQVPDSIQYYPSIVHYMYRSMEVMTKALSSYNSTVLLAKESPSLGGGG